MKAFTGIFAMATGILLAGVLASNSLSYAQSEIYGTMMVVKGEIKVTSAKSGKTDSARVGFKVYSGDAIVSGADSRAKIIMSDKNVINVSPDSKVTIAKYENNPAKDSRNVELKVDYGKVRASVEQNYDGEKNKFNVRTPTAVAGVRGTDFIASFNPQTRQTSIVTFSGIVAVGTPGANGQISNPVFVRPGQSTDVSEGQPAETPKAVPQDQMKNINQESSADTAKGGPAAGPDTGTPTNNAKSDEPKSEEPAKVDGPKPETASNEAKPDSGSGTAPKADSPGNEPKKEPAPASSSTVKTDGPAPSNSGSSERAPASIPPTASLFDAKKDSPKNNPIPVMPGTVKTPTIATQPPKIPAVITQPTNNFIDNAVRNQKSRVRVEICLPGTGC